MMRLLIIACSLICSMPCAAQKINTSIYGKWQYHSGSGGFTGKGPGWSPADKIILELKKNGSYCLQAKNKKTVSDKFMIVQKNTMEGEKQFVLDLKKGIDQSYELRGDTLLLTEQVNDGFSYLFLRKKS